VARPAGPGPHPAVAILHGSHGFATEYVDLARALAGGGLVAVAACWAASGSGAGTAYVTPIACADAPPMPEPGSPAATPIVAALVDAVRTLPGVRADRIGLFGHSRGGGAVLGYLLAGGRVQAAVLHSTGYPPERVAAAGRIGTSVLILHGVADGPSDGGGPMTGIARARAFEAALRRAGRSVDAHYYDAGEHNGLFRDPAQREDRLARMSAFFGTVLR
jgi:dienelactone hydrolase